ncbi:ARHGB factor, partial [Vidua chalybeata]|nr:ARHGB factor [Vidua chalybeata]
YPVFSPCSRSRCRYPVFLPAQDPEVRKHAAQILRNMLRQEEAELQRCQALLQRQPGAAVGRQLEAARRRLGQLQLKVQQEARGAAALGARPVEGEFLRSLAGPGSGSPQLPGRCPRHPRDADPESGPERGSARPQIIGPEEDCEPGSVSNESDSVFQDLGILKSRPAHLAVFLRFLFSQADPTPLLFHLCSEVCCQLSNPRDSRALGRNIWNIFLDRSA